MLGKVVNPCKYFSSLYFTWFTSFATLNMIFSMFDLIKRLYHWLILQGNISLIWRISHFIPFHLSLKLNRILREWVITKFQWFSRFNFKFIFCFFISYFPFLSIIVFEYVCPFLKRFPLRWFYVEIY
jgi:hypothetical protein